jgi:uncharacterized protein (TIGR02271 family)
MAGGRVDTAALETLTDDQLRVRARDGGVPGADTLSRADLLGALAEPQEMTRSEERLVAGTEVYATGRARLRKYVITEDVQITIQVRREELRIEREPIPEGSLPPVEDPDVFGGPDIEIILHEERPLISTEIVPVQRVRLAKVVHTDEHVVAGQVRKERIEADLPGRPTATLD